MQGSQTLKQYRASVCEMFEDYASTHPVLQEAELEARHREGQLGQLRMERRASRRLSTARRESQLGVSAEKLDPQAAKRRSLQPVQRQPELSEGPPQAEGSQRFGRRSTVGGVDPKESMALQMNVDNERSALHTNSNRTPVPPRSSGSMLHPPGEKDPPKMDQRSDGLPNLASDDESSAKSSAASSPRVLQAMDSRNGSIVASSSNLSHRASAARMSVPTLDLSSITGDPPKVSSTSNLSQVGGAARGAPSKSPHGAQANGKNQERGTTPHSSQHQPNSTLSGRTGTPKTKPTMYQVSGGCGDLQTGLEQLANELRVHRNTGTLGPSKLSGRSDRTITSFRGDGPKKIDSRRNEPFQNVQKELHSSRRRMDDAREPLVTSYLRGEGGGNNEDLDRQPPQPLDPPLYQTMQEMPLGDGFSLVTEVQEYADGQQRRGSTYLKVEGQPLMLLEKDKQQRFERKNGGKSKDHGEFCKEPVEYVSSANLSTRTGASLERDWTPANFDDTGRTQSTSSSTLELLARATSIDSLSVQKKLSKEPLSIAQRYRHDHSQSARQVDTHKVLHGTLSNMAAKLATGQLRNHPEDPWVVAEQLRIERDAWRSESNKLKIQALELQQKLMSTQQEARYWHQHPLTRPYHSLKGFGNGRKTIQTGQHEDPNAAQTADALRQCLQKVQALKEELLGNNQENQHHREPDNEAYAYFPETGGYAF